MERVILSEKELAFWGSVDTSRGREMRRGEKLGASDLELGVQDWDWGLGGLVLLELGARVEILVTRSCSGFTEGL